MFPNNNTCVVVEYSKYAIEQWQQASFILIGVCTILVSLLFIFSTTQMMRKCM